jgi:hypothetical protein
VQLSPARLPRQAGGPAEKDYREWDISKAKQADAVEGKDVFFVVLK